MRRFANRGETEVNHSETRELGLVPRSGWLHPKIVHLEDACVPLRYKAMPSWVGEIEDARGLSWQE